MRMNDLSHCRHRLISRCPNSVGGKSADAAATARNAVIRYTTPQAIPVRLLAHTGQYQSAHIPQPIPASIAAKTKHVSTIPLEEPVFLSPRGSPSNQPMRCR